MELDQNTALRPSSPFKATSRFYRFSGRATVQPKHKRNADRSFSLEADTRDTTLLDLAGFTYLAQPVINVDLIFHLSQVHEMRIHLSTLAGFLGTAAAVLMPTPTGRYGVGFREFLQKNLNFIDQEGKKKIL